MRDPCAVLALNTSCCNAMSCMQGKPWCSVGMRATKDVRGVSYQIGIPILADVKMSQASNAPMPSKAPASVSPAFDVLSQALGHWPIAQYPAWSDKMSWKAGSSPAGAHRETAYKAGLM
ncbi:hypothetical protein DUNSADRAFT_8314 [Dunaliella salina]|uniref:Encoded protein n=1 Tax=Dunaliella salina TaxID=3046 RepID=A0ABQ7H612_DUNSA|nr:hypothetical protein DUNSADRAFT_8314 [Dunaliella salina]|eukprot:KAF5842251.1 hypothetical protein DUNSADRAFT_8314 [Dunaliella salina]